MVMLHKTSRLLVVACLVTFCSAVNAEPSKQKIDLGDSEKTLIEVRGKPDSIKELKLQDRTFKTFYYKNTNTFYVIDLKIGKICEIGLGETQGYCYPCDYGPSAGTCP